MKYGIRIVKGGMVIRTQPVYDNAISAIASAAQLFPHEDWTIYDDDDEGSPAESRSLPRPDNPLPNGEAAVIQMHA